MLRAPQDFSPSLIGFLNAPTVFYHKSSVGLLLIFLLLLISNVFSQESIHSAWTLSSDSESFHDHSPKREDHTDQVETSQHQLSGEEDSADGLVFGNDRNFPSKKGSTEKSSQKQIDINSHTPVKGKKIKGSAKGKSSGGDVKVEEEETSEKLAESDVRTAKVIVTA